MKTILHVDDDPNDVFLLQHALRKAGVVNPIQVASDGQQAIDYLQGAGKFADRAKFPFPCLVLLDLKWPFIIGLDVLRWIRQQTGTVLTVLMLTASGSEEDIVEACRLGANAFLTKPSEAGRLEEMVRAIKDFWLTHNTLPRASAPESQLARGVWRVVSTTDSVAPPGPTSMECLDPSGGAMPRGRHENSFSRRSHRGASGAEADSGRGVQKGRVRRGAP